MPGVKSVFITVSLCLGGMLFLFLFVSVNLTLQKSVAHNYFTVHREHYDEVHLSTIVISPRVTTETHKISSVA